jgi:hypothetical protein
LKYIELLLCIYTLIIVIKHLEDNMALGAVVGFIGKKVLPKVAEKVLPKVAEMGLEKVAGKGGKEVAKHIFEKIGGEAGEKAGKKIFGELAQKALKGDKDALSQLLKMGKDILELPGLGKDAAGLALKTLVNSTVGGGGDAVRKIFGLTGNTALGLPKEGM